MNLNLKAKYIFFLTTCTLLFSALVFTSCSKDDDTATNKYQLEGTWQLYKMTTGAIVDSTYEPSDQNEIIFAPRFYWRYVNGAVSDSGNYTLIKEQQTAQQFIGQIDYGTSINQFITIKGDTLSLSSPGIIANAAIYIKSSDNSDFQQQ
jgi:hypothetical protein